MLIIQEILGYFLIGIIGMVILSVCYLPIYFILRMRKLWSTTICMMLFSFLIEFIQYFVGRSADIDDLMLNTLGGILGYLVFYIFSKLFKDKNIWKKLNGIAS